MFGRKVIYTPVSEINRDNVVKELTKAIRIHNDNRAQIDYLYSYYCGDQPILYREKLIRPEINNTVVSNHAYEIVSFKTGYVFGEPIQYVKRSEGDDTDLVKRLNDCMLLENKPARDKELAEWFYICGTAYRMTLQGENGNPFEIDTLDPRDTFVVYNSGFKKRPLMGVTQIKNEDGDIIYTVYTNNRIFTIKNGVDIIKEVGHIYGTIPIQEYPANNARLGAFEIVLPLLDALNNVLSNRLDGVEQHIQSFLKFINCEIDKETFEKLKMEGALTVKGEPGLQADVDLVTAELSQTETQVLADNIYSSMLIICGIPNRHGATKSTSDTGQAVMLRDGWGDAESRARDTELIFKQSERQFLRLALRIMEIREGMNLSPTDVDIKFTRNKSENAITKSQSMQNQLEGGIHPRIAIATCGLYSDPEEVYAESKEYLEKWKYKKPEITPGNNKPNNENEGNPAEGGA